MKTLVAESPGELAKRVGDALNEYRGEPLYRRLPYNRYEDYLNHLTWLVPGPEQVAFCRNKFFFDWQDEDAGEIWFGFHFEKGLILPAVSSKSSKYLMTADWSWHSVIQEFGAEPMLAATDAVNNYFEGTGTVQLLVTPSNNGIRPDQVQRVTFKLEQNKLSLSNKSGPGNLEPLFQCASMMDVRNALQDWSDSGWFWVDLLLGYRTKIEARAGVDQRKQAEDLARNAFIPLEKWVY